MREPVSGAGAGTRYHHGDLRRALLDAALGILEEDGDLSLRAVARRAGVSHAAPYHHFADRRALVAALATEALTEFGAALRRAAEAAADAPACTMEVGVAYVRFAVEHPAQFRLMFSAELSDREGLPDLQAAYDAAYGVLLDGMRDLLGPGATEAVISGHATYAWALVHGLSNLLLDRQVAPHARTPEEVEAFARRVLGGMPPPGTAVTGSPPPAG